MNTDQTDDPVQEQEKKSNNSKGDICYEEYLQLDKLLSSQRLLSKDHRLIHDEHLFVIIHQTYELWFKQILYELDGIRSMFIINKGYDGPVITEITRMLNRIMLILKVLIDQMIILETMTALDFLEFRNYLSPASGFQSLQFRLIENKLGLKQTLRSKLHHTGIIFTHNPKLMMDLKNSEVEPSLEMLVQKWLENIFDLENNKSDFLSKYKEAVNEWLVNQRNTALEIRCEKSKEVLVAEVKRRTEWFNTIFDEHLHKALVERGERSFSFKAFLGALIIMLYKDNVYFAQSHLLLTQLMDIDTLIAKWRYNHMLMVHRMIGSQNFGTGGTSGYHYLRSTTRDQYTVFLDLFNMPAFLLPRDYIPPLYSQVLEDLRKGNSKFDNYNQ